MGKRIFLVGDKYFSSEINIFRRETVFCLTHVLFFYSFFLKLNFFF